MKQKCDSKIDEEEDEHGVSTKHCATLLETKTENQNNCCASVTSRRSDWVCARCTLDTLPVYTVNN